MSKYNNNINDHERRKNAQTTMIATKTAGHVAPLTRINNPGFDAAH